MLKFRASHIADVVGKLWAMPNSMVGVVYGMAGHLIGLAMRTDPAVDFGDNALRFRNNPLMATAMVFGNVIVYGCGQSYQPHSRRGDHTLGDEERQHTRQAQWLGPLYFPAHLLSGCIGLAVHRDWHGRGTPCAFLEVGPHADAPGPWPWKFPSRRGRAPGITAR